MRFWMPMKDGKTNTLKVGLNGKEYDVVKDEKSNGRPMVDTGGDDVPPQILGHLITLGWQFADARTAKGAVDKIGVKLDPAGQPVKDETLKKNT